MTSGKDRWNKNVFRCRRNEYSDWADVTLWGRLFHTRGAATGKARLPTDDSLTCGIHSTIMMLCKYFTAIHRYVLRSSHMVGVDDSSLKANSRPKIAGLVGLIINANKPNKLSQWYCYDVSITNIVTGLENLLKHHTLSCSRNYLFKTHFLTEHFPPASFQPADFHDTVMHLCS